MDSVRNLAAVRRVQSAHVQYKQVVDVPEEVIRGNRNDAFVASRMISLILLTIHFADVAM